VKFGLIFANLGRFSGRRGLVELAQGAEAAGFDSVWTVEHVVLPDDFSSRYPFTRDGAMPMSTADVMPDPLIWMAQAAAVTDRLRVGTGVLILPLRNPLVLAKELATLDHLSGGRVDLGVGLGWLREEFDVVGVPWDRRGSRAEEYVAAMRALWTTDPTDFAGEFVNFARVRCNPKPAQRSVPIHIGGASRAAAERAGRIGDGFFPGKGNLAELVDIVRQTAVAHGRDPNAIEVMAGHPRLMEDPLAYSEELRGAGVDRVAVPVFPFHRDTADRLAEFGKTVIARTAVARV
jgi:probable F420-dependent oxidoreductase